MNNNKHKSYFHSFHCVERSQSDKFKTYFIIKYPPLQWKHSKQQHQHYRPEAGPGVLEEERWQRGGYSTDGERLQGRLDRR